MTETTDTAAARDAAGPELEGSWPKPTEDRTLPEARSSEQIRNGRGRGRTRWLVAAVVVAAIAATTAVAILDGGDSESTSAPATATGTSVVVTADLRSTEDLAGTLTFLEGPELLALRSSTDLSTSASQGAGGGDSAEGSTGISTLTSVVQVGAVIEPGDVVWTIDARPTVLMAGSFPAWRDLETDVEPGPDVAQLEATLSLLGYDPDATMTIDEEFTSATEAVVEAFQVDLGYAAEDEADGVVLLGDVIFVGSPLRVAETPIAVGSGVGSGATVVVTSVTDTVIRMDVSADDRALLTPGAGVVVVLPDFTEVSGTVFSTGSVAQTSQDGVVTFEAIVALDDSSVADGLDEASVTVEVVTEERLGVMALPVTALAALAEGGYAVEVVDASGVTRLVAVEPGLFAEGLVEIEADLASGDVIVVPA